MSEPLSYDVDEEMTYNLIPTIEKFHNCGAQKRCIVGPVGCYSGDTEFLSPNGWVRFDEYDGHQRVAQWEFRKDSLSFVYPEAYIKEPCVDFIYFKNNTNISMLLSDEHKMPLFDERAVLHFKTAGDVAILDKEWYIPQPYQIKDGIHPLFVYLSKATCSVERVPSEDGFKYCFTVPTGFLVVRHNGMEFISGNSGKTTAACWEVCYFLPKFMFEVHGVKKTIFVVVRNTSIELRDTTLRSLQEWFPFAEYKVQAMILTITWPNFEVELMLRACDNAKHVRQFKSLQVTGYWIDESIEVAEDTKRMLKTRIGRFPKRSPAKFGIETTNPPDVEHPTYSQFKWDTPPPGPKPSGKPLEKHAGFWQPPYENIANLPINYYEDLKADYADNLDWLEMYVEGKPGQLIRGKLVYDNFDRTLHMSEFTLKWGGQHLFRGWDNSGNTPACIVVCPVTPGRLHIFREFVTVRENAVDFANRVIEQCNIHFPGAKFTDYGDPAGEAQYSTRDGTFTSNKQLMSDECGIDVISGEQNFKKRVNSVDQALLRRDGILIDPSCVRLYNGFMGGYHYPELKNLPGRFMPEPQKNKYAHIAEALQYVCTMLYVSAAPPIDESEVYPDEEMEASY